MIIPGPYQYLGAFAAAFAAGVVSAVAVMTAIRLKPAKAN
jgi:hypothetical protein